MCCYCCVGVPLQLNDLKRALLDKDQLLQEYEYEKSQMQRRMEELGQRLADKSSSLEGSRSVSASAPGALVGLTPSSADLTITQRAKAG